MSAAWPSGGRRLDHFALWTALGAGMFLMPSGALLVPALSVERAVLATIVAAALAALVVASIASIAARSGDSTLDLLSRPFGGRARPLVAALLVVRHVLFAAFALVLITDSATLIGERSLGADLRPVWAVLFAFVALAIVFRLHRSWRLWRVWAAVSLLVAAGITVSAYAEYEIPSYLTRPAAGGWPSFWQAVDVMLVFPLLWLPVVADYARSASSPRAAAHGAFAGLLLMAVWFGTLGIIYLPATDAGDIPGFLVAMQLGLGALLILLVLQLDEVAVNAGVAVQVFAGERLAPLRHLVAPAVLIAALPAAMLLQITSLEPYLVLAGSVFVPAFAVVIAHALWPVDRPLAAPIVAWAGGFLLYQWITPAEIGWWQDILDPAAGVFGLPFPLTDEVTWLGGAIPAFLFAFAVHAAAALLPVPRLAGRPSATPG